MKAAISVLGRFHAFELAQGLAEQNALGQLLTTYPAYFPRSRFGIPDKALTTAPWVEVIRRGYHKLPASLKRLWDVDSAMAALFDRWSALTLRPENEIFIGWSGSSLSAIRRAKSLGMMTFLERGSAHILSQLEILTAEYAKWGLHYDETPREIIDRELQEYDEVDYVCVPSQFALRTFLEKKYPAEKLLVNPYGVNLQWFRPQPKPDKIFRVIFCGGLTLQKGTPYLVEAFLKLKLPQSELVLIGALSDVLKSWLNQKRLENPSIQWLGSVPQDKLSNYFTAGDLFCLPSLQDGFGMVIPQAMACGLPILTTNHTGGADYVVERENGFVVRPGDVTALAEKIQWCFEHRRDCQEMGRKALAFAKKDLSWKLYGERALKNYQMARENALHQLSTPSEKKLSSLTGV